MMGRHWTTRVVAIVCVSAITLYAMHLEIDGWMVPAFGMAVAAGIAGYEIGAETATRAVEKYKWGGRR